MKEKLCKCLIVLMLMALIFLGVILYFEIFVNALDYKKCDCEFAYHFEPHRDKQQIICEINNITHTNYKVVFCDIRRKCEGRCNLFRIELASDLSSYGLAWVYTHEIMHKAKHSFNERYVQFEAFKTLYESGDAYYQQVALWQANQMQKQGEMHDCAWYIKKYLEEKQK